MSKFIPIDKLKTLRDSARTGDERALKVLSSFRTGAEDFSSLLDEYFNPQQTEAQEVKEQQEMPIVENPQGNILEKMEEVGEKATNKALSNVAINSVKCGKDKNPLIEFITALISDENEAIEGYDKAILFVANSQTDRNALNVLNEIKNDEIRHIKMLKELLN